MIKKILALISAVVMVFSIGMISAYAVDAGESRAVIAADITQEQIDTVYANFGIEQGSAKELTVTNQDERKYLEGLVSEAQIGNVAISCVYIETLEEGSGVQLNISNIKWCTSEMYQNALETAGITDANVRITAPYPVSGTAALTGIYLAYEDITGEKLSEDAKATAAEELVLTGELGDMIGTANAAELVNELKGILNETQKMSDDEVRSEIKRIASELNVEITDSQVEQLLKLCRSLEGLDSETLQKRIEGFADTINKVNEAGNTVSKIGQKIQGFFASIGNFFSNLFGGNK